MPSPSKLTIDTRQHATKMRLLDVAAELLDQMDFNEVICDLVLERAKVSKGSLYYHFQNFPDLMEQVVIQKLRHARLISLNSLVETFQLSDSPQQIIENIMSSTSGIKQSKEIYVLSTTAKFLALNSPRMCERNAEVTRQELNCWTAIVEICVLRGWSNRKVDPATVAILFTAISSFAPEPIEEEINLQESHQFKAFAFLFETILFNALDLKEATASPTSDELTYLLDTSQEFDFLK